MSSSSSTTTGTTVETPSWNLNADYVETCNCDYGCPCNLSGFPAYRSCRSLILFHIRAGSYGNTKLEGLDIISAIAWPKAIHEGNGTDSYLLQTRLMKNKSYSSKFIRLSLISLY